eukprot:g3148.t1
MITPTDGQLADVAAPAASSMSRGGLKKRPRGRGPTGKAWDPFSGGWVSAVPPSRTRATSSGRMPRARDFLEVEGRQSRADPYQARDARKRLESKAKGKADRAKAAEARRSASRRGTPQVWRSRAGSDLISPSHARQVRREMKKLEALAVHDDEEAPGGKESGGPGALSAASAPACVSRAAIRKAGEVSTEPAKVLAAACDAILADHRVAKQSELARSRARKRNAAKKARAAASRTSERVAERAQTNAFWQHYGRYCSAAEAEQIRMDHSYETVEEAEARVEAGGAAEFRHTMLDDKAAVARVGFKLETLLDVTCPNWEDKHHSDFDGNPMGSFAEGKGLFGKGGWQQAGIDGDGTDTLLGDTDYCDIRPTVRGRLLKAVIQLGSRAPASFSAGTTRVRRRPFLKDSPPNVRSAAVRTGDVIDEHAKAGRMTLKVGKGHVHCGGGTRANPVERFNGTLMLDMCWAGRIHAHLLKLYESGEFQAQRPSQVNAYNEQERLELLRQAHVEGAGQMSEQEQRDAIVRAYNVVSTIPYGDGADVSKAHPTVAQFVQIVYYPWQWRTRSAARLTEIIQGLVWRAGVDTWGRCGGRGTEIRDHVKVLAEPLWRAGGGGTERALAGGQPPLAWRDVVAGGAGAGAGAGAVPVDGDAPVLQYEWRWLKGDIAHNQRVIGIAAAGFDNDPVQDLRESERGLAMCVALAPFRTLQTVVQSFGSGPSGPENFDADAVYSADLKDAWKDIAHRQFGGARPTNYKTAEGLMRDVLRGATLLSGALCGDPERVTSRRVAGGDLSCLPDTMHCIGGYAKIVIEAGLKRMKAHANPVKAELQARNVMRYETQRNHVTAGTC